MCKNCKDEYKLDESLLKRKVPLFRCPNCKNTLKVRRHEPDKQLKLFNSEYDTFAQHKNTPKNRNTSTEKDNILHEVFGSFLKGDW